MEVGLALPQFDYALPGERPLRWETTLSWARRAEELGFGSVWVADHLFMEIAKYGAGPGRFRGVDPLVALGALASATSTVRIGTLVLCSPLRPAMVAGKALATVDRLSAGRLVAGVGAGWLEAEFVEAGIPFGTPGERLATLAGAVDGWRRLWLAAPGAPPCRPGPVQPGGPPIWVGGRGDRLLTLVAHLADGWNAGGWTQDPAHHARRVEVLERACDIAGRDPATVALSVNLTALVGEDEADLARRFDRLAAAFPGTVREPLASWRRDRLVGTVEEVGGRLAEWRERGVAAVILSLGALPFSVVAQEDLDLVAAAVGAS